jgi:hypothetical protein
MIEQVFPYGWCAEPLGVPADTVTLQERHVTLNGALDRVETRGATARFHRRCAVEARQSGGWGVVHEGG